MKKKYYVLFHSWQGIATESLKDQMWGPGAKQQSYQSGKGNSERVGEAGFEKIDN